MLDGRANLQITEKTCACPLSGQHGLRAEGCAAVCRQFKAGTNMPLEAKTLDGSAILRVAFGPSGCQAAVSTMGGLYYLDPFAEGVQPSKPGPSA